jgi:hypothetical protein
MVTNAMDGRIALLATQQNEDQRGLFKKIFAKKNKDLPYLLLALKLPVLSRFLT